jgi:hypothetical protein
MNVRFPPKADVRCDRSRQRLPSHAPAADYARGRVARSRHASESKAGYSANPLLLSGRRSPACLCLGFGLGQEAEARLAPREINAYIQQSIGTPAWTGKFHDRDNTVGLPDSQGHRPARGMVWRGIDAENEIARSDSVAHSFHPLAWEKD